MQIFLRSLLNNRNTVLSWGLPCSLSRFLINSSVPTSQLWLLPTENGLWLVSGMCALLDNSIEDPQNCSFPQIKDEFQQCRLNFLRPSEIRWWDLGKYSSPPYNTVLLYSGKCSGNTPESDVRLLLMLLTTTARRILIAWRLWQNLE